MKELSIEEKAQRYDEAFGRAKGLYAKGAPDSLYLEEMFPELKESEDEKIREAIIDTLNRVDQRIIEINYGIKHKDAIAWLEKQGEQKPADKVEPKFHFKVGQWIVATGKCVYLITKIDGFNVTLVDTNGDEYVFDASSLDDAHEWTIQDAKDGDVLACPLPKGHEGEEQVFIFKCINSRDYVDNCIEYYCRVCEGVFYENENGYMGTTSSPLYPATKEQRNVLMKAMADAGYTFDFEKKELRKLKFRVGDIVKSKSQPMLDTRKIISIGKDCYWCEDRGCIGFAWEDDCEIVEQKPAGNKGMNLVEEEMTPFQKKVFCIIDTTIEEEQGLKQVCDELFALASNEIKQESAEWSEEDEAHIDSLLKRLEAIRKPGAAFIPTGFAISEDADWLKYLKDRVGCEANCTTTKGWKPSDDQIEALESATENWAYGEYQDSLKELIKQLKQL